jgi:hypothetical protein
MASEIVTTRSIYEPLNPDVDSYCWANGGWEDAAWGSVQDARTTSTTRGQAAMVFARETGHFPDVRVWKRYVRPLTRIDAWEDSGQDRWEQDHGLGHMEGPENPPDLYEPTEATPVWEIVHRTHPEAIPVWICGVKGDNPPESPEPPDSKVLAGALNRQLCRQQGHAWGVEDCLRCHEPITAREAAERA